MTRPVRGRRSPRPLSTQLAQTAAPHAANGSVGPAGSDADRPAVHRKPGVLLGPAVGHQPEKPYNGLPPPAAVQLRPERTRTLRQERDVQQRIDCPARSPTPTITAPVPLDLVTASGQRPRPARQPGRRRAYQVRPGGAGARKLTDPEQVQANWSRRHTEPPPVRPARGAAGERAGPEPGPGRRNADMTNMRPAAATPDDTRSDPDALRARRQRRSRGCRAGQAEGVLRRHAAGVGKTYAMLSKPPAQSPGGSAGRW